MISGNKKNFLILFLFYYQHVHLSQITPLIAVKFLMKDIFGINIQKKLNKNGEHQFIFS